MLKVSLIGQEFWTKKLAEQINRYSDNKVCSYSVVRYFEKPILKIKQLLSADILLRVGYRPGAATVRGIVFDLFWWLLRTLRPSIKAFYYWIGTDVINSINDFHKDKLVNSFFNYSKRELHIAGAPWLVEELKSIGINATFTLFPAQLPTVSSLEPLPENFTVLTYIPDSRHNFYGGDAICQAAKQLPDIRFNVVGGKGEWLKDFLPNLFFHGWQNDLRPFYTNATVVVRFVSHDAVGGIVREGLTLGRHVIYTYPLPFTHKVRFGDVESLIGTLRDMLELHKKGQLKLNF